MFDVYETIRVANPTVYLDAYCLLTCWKRIRTCFNKVWQKIAAHLQSCLVTRDGTGFMLFIRKIDIWFPSVWYSTHRFHTCGSCHALVTNETHHVEEENVTLPPLEDLHTFSHLESHCLPAFRLGRIRTWDQKQEDRPLLHTRIFTCIQRALQQGQQFLKQNCTWTD